MSPVPVPAVTDQATLGSVASTGNTSATISRVSPFTTVVSPPAPVTVIEATSTAGACS